MRKIFGILFSFTMAFMPFISSAQILSVELISVDSDETIGDGLSLSYSMSSDGRYVLFSSASTNLVASDTNGEYDLFVRDTTLGTTERISVSSAEAEGNGQSLLGSMSSDGRYIAFSSTATNLVAGDSNSSDDIFLRDTTLGTTIKITEDTADGDANGDSGQPQISEDGRYIVFYSDATDLIASDTNSARDVFIYDRDEDTFEAISVSSSEVLGNADSGGNGFTSVVGDGRYVLFDSVATNLTGDTDTNSEIDVFLRDRTLGTTELISFNSDEDGTANGASTAGGVSENGRYVVFHSDATDIVSGDTNGTTDIFLRDRTLGTTTRVSVSTTGTQGNGASTIPTISSNGRFITFGSSATNLVSGDTNGDPDVFMHDTLTGVTERISLTEDGEEADGNLFNVTLGFITPNAQYVIVASGHTDIVDGDTNGEFDVFLYELDDSDGVSAEVEKAAPNNGDVNENNFIDSVEDNISSFVNAVSGNYATIETTGDCVRNDSPSASAESSLGTQDADYDYPLGIIDFSITCSDTGESATVTVYCFCENTPVAGLVARKYNSSTGEYATIDDAVISEVTIDGNRALKMVYTVTDGGELDEDGLENGTIVDPVGFAQPAVVASSGSSSTGGGIKYGCKDENAINYDRFSRHDPELCRYETDNFVVTGDYAKPLEDISCTPFTTLMKLGSKQGEVAKLQQTLNTLGFNTGPVDGWFGNLTNAGVKAFQASQNIDADGIVGPVTRGELNGFCN